MKSLFRVGAIKVVARPRLWPAAVVQLWRIRRSGWWKSFPFLPFPDMGYIDFRLTTAYGYEDPSKHFESDLVTYLEWCRSWRKLSK